MSRMYKLMIEASKPATADELLLQAELDQFLNERVNNLDCEQTKLKSGKEYIRWVGVATVSGSQQAYHDKIKEFLQEAAEDKDVKVKTSWLELEHYDETIGEVDSK